MAVTKKIKGIRLENQVGTLFATLEGDLRLEQDKAQTVKLTLVKEGGKFKVKAT